MKSATREFTGTLRKHPAMDMAELELALKNGHH